jgi:hypothetical protein
MSIELWIDTLCSVWDISDGKGGQVKSYRVYNKNEFPEAITTYPCAISYVTSVKNTYGASNSLDLWYGVTEFHLFPNVNKTNLPEAMLFYKRIRDAAALHMTLGGLVNYFLLRNDIESQTMVDLKYGSEDPHHGLLVNWIVKELPNVTIGA